MFVCVCVSQNLQRGGLGGWGRWGRRKEEETRRRRGSRWEQSAVPLKHTEWRPEWVTSAGHTPATFWVCVCVCMWTNRAPRDSRFALTWFTKSCLQGMHTNTHTYTNIHWKTQWILRIKSEWDDELKFNQTDSFVILCVWETCASGCTCGEPLNNTSSCFWCTAVAVVYFLPELRRCPCVFSVCNFSCSRQFAFCRQRLL